MSPATGTERPSKARRAAGKGKGPSNRLEAAAALLAWRKGRGLSCIGSLSVLDLDRGDFELWQRWEAGEEIPPAKVRAVLATRTRIPAVAWTTAPPLPAVRPLARRDLGTSAPASLAKWRELRALSPLDAADRLNVTGNTWRSWESGETVPRGPTRAALARIAGVPVELWTAEDKPATGMEVQR